tara:strand:- start:8383 stop:8796 length:414 start_codon:yes stop_codon:yes gene_type:complete
MYKPFNKKLHETYDERARTATKNYVKKQGHEAIDNPDKYGADLIVEGLCYLECEIKRYWDKDYYPYYYIRLPYRKKKFANLEMPTLFYIWNNKCSAAVRIQGSKLHTAEVKEYKNSQMPKGELFFWFVAKEHRLVHI